MQPFIQPQLRTIKPCPECGGQRVVAEEEERCATRLIQRGRYTGPLGKRSNTSGAFAFVCIQCGYISWYATEPSHLIPDQ